MKTIYFKHNGGKQKNVKNQIAGWLALGDHAIHRYGTHLLTCECVTARELEGQANCIKKLIDEAVSAAKRKLP